MKLSKLIPILAGGIIGAQALYGFARDTSTLIRPPGANSEGEFLSRCIKCGKCILACPYKAIKTADLVDGYAVGTPCLDVRSQACRLCEDFPCVEACPTEALHSVENREDVDMGIAVIDEDLCIAFDGMRCEVCYRICPLIDDAITIDFRSREHDSIHTLFVPEINEEACVGCGLCVERCVVDDPEVAIHIERKHE